MPATLELEPAQDPMTMVQTLEYSPNPMIEAGDLAPYALQNPETTDQEDIVKVAKETGSVSLEGSVVKPPSQKVEELLEHSPEVDAAEIAQRFNLSQEQSEGVVSTAEVREPAMRIAINLPRYGLEGMLEEGRKKSQFEAGYGGTKGLSTRVQAERKLGIAPEPGEEDISYGYLTDTTLERQGNVGGGIASGYGDATIILKPEVSERSTFTIGDSVSPTSGGSRLMGFRDAVKMETAREVAEYTPGARRDYYTEAQIQGGIKLSDIESITVDVASQEQPSQQGEKAWSKVEDIEHLIKDVSERAPGVPLTVRLPDGFGTSGTLSSEMAELVDKYPEVTFVVVLKAESPFRLENKFSETKEDVSDIITEARENHDRAKARKDKLEDSGIQEYWQTRFGKDAPQNLKIQMSAVK